MNEAIKFEHVSKRYLRGTGHEGLRETLSRTAGRLLGRKREGRESQVLWALQDVNFSLQAGSVLGIIGANGAGKTTALKLLSRVTRPTSGKIQTGGRIASLIELGAGFHPDLTGRENIYLNGTIMGLSQKEIRERFDTIVAFAELESFIDTPVKRYSSGMYARLGFAVAAHVDPDILLVDEVLAVGDEVFQIKCFDFIHTFAKSGRTSVFVSHNLHNIDQLCDEVIWLDHGQIARIGAPGEVLRAFMDEMDRRLVKMKQEKLTSAEDYLQIHDLRIMDATGHPCETFRPGEDITIALDYELNGRAGRPYFCIWVSEAQSRVPLFAANMILDGFSVSNGHTPSTVACRFRSVPLMPRAYSVWVEAYGDDRSKILYKWRVLGGFRVSDEDRPSERQNAPMGVYFKRAHGPIQVPYEWIT